MGFGIWDMALQAREGRRQWREGERETGRKGGKKRRDGQGGMVGINWCLRHVAGGGGELKREGARGARGLGSQGTHQEPQGLALQEAMGLLGAWGPRMGPCR